MAQTKRESISSRRILAGVDEPIFRVLPQEILTNLFKPASETAVLWNLIYPRAKPSLALEQWMAIPPLAGTPSLLEKDEMIPFFWGYSATGEPFPALDEALHAVDGDEARTELDLILLGKRNIVVAEAKNLARLGRCTRFQHGRCPEIHPVPRLGVGSAACRYWEGDTSRFTDQLDFGDRPSPAELAPLCNRHYQLARVLLVGTMMAKLLNKPLHFWLITPKSRWGGFRADWQDLTGRIRDEALWRRSRVLAWEGIASIPAR